MKLIERLRCCSPEVPTYSGANYRLGAKLRHGDEGQ
jgi:hypothetical protein